MHQRTRQRSLDATESQTAVKNAVRRSQPIEIDMKVLRLWSGIWSLADPGGSGQDQHASNTLVERDSGNTSI